jgi:hypothetical protein
VILSRLVPALKRTDPNTLLATDQPRLYQVCVYGRATGHEQPDWTATIRLHQLDRHLDQLRQMQTAQPEPMTQPEIAGVVWSQSAAAVKSPPASAGDAALALSNRSLARRGDPDGIARYLSETLSALGVAVRVTVKTMPYPGQAKPIAATVPTLRRLCITCEANYSPDPALIAEPIAQKLRELELEDFRDAITLVQVWGETKPDWMLRVDLTPQQEMLREWARWGDVGAISRLLRQTLADHELRLDTTTLKESTLHICCGAVPSSFDRQQVMAVVTPLLERLAPQGIHAAAVYAQVSGQDTPAWVEWLTLPASQHAALSESAVTLAQQGDWQAIVFLLNRLLNPDLDKQLATGGIRLQLLPRQDLLHVMVDAPTCPSQRQVSPIVTRFLKSLKLPGIAGIRLYGRRSGQKRPLWSEGVDFTARQRFVPEATPEFAATDAYVGDLISRSDEMVLRPDLTPADVQSAWTQFKHRSQQTVQQSLLRSQVFAPSATEQIAAPRSTPQQSPPQQSVRTAIVWSAVGLLLTVQADWLMARMLQAANDPTDTLSPPIASPAPAAPASPLAGLSLNRSTADDPDAFDETGFTSAAGEINLNPANPPDPAATNAPASAAILTAENPFPTFNSRQLDEKIALYSQRLAESGPPDVLIVGSSRALRGVDPAALRQALAELGYANVSVFNFGVNGATAQVVNLILQRLLTPEQLPRLIVWADGARAFNSGSVDVTYNGIVVSAGYRELASGSSPLPEAELPADGTTGLTAAPTSGIGASLTASYQKIDRWLSQRLAAISATYRDRDRLKSLLQETVTDRLPRQSAPQPTAIVSADSAPPPAEAASLPNQGQGMIDFDGFLPLSVRFNPATYYQQYARVSGEYDSDYEAFQINGRQAVALQSLLQFTSAHSIPVVFVNLPLTQDYLDPVRLQREQEFKQYMLRLSVNQQGLIFRDLGQLWLDRPDYFSDPSHLNRYGAYEVSQRLAQDPMIPWVEATQPAPNP